MEELKKIASRTRSWTTFSNDIDDVIANHKKQEEDV